MDDLYDYKPETRQPQPDSQPQKEESNDWLAEYDAKEDGKSPPDDYTVLREKGSLGSAVGSGLKKIPFAELIFIFIASLFLHSDVFLSRVLNKIPGTVIGREVTTRGECTIALLLCLMVLIFGILHNLQIV